VTLVGGGGVFLNTPPPPIISPPQHLYGWHVYEIQAI